jgi:UDP-N-acetylmuramoylalanine--D-glutamate ligase
MENYLKSLENFIKGKKIVLNHESDKFKQLSEEANESYFFTKSPYKLKLFGDFNRKNAAAAAKTAEIIGIPDETIAESLKKFRVLPGRSTIIDLQHSKIVVGKTDNADAAAAVLDEAEFPVIILGTPRKGEICRLEIFREVSKTNSKIVAIFPGLDDTCEDARNILKEENYLGEVVYLSNVEEVVEFALRCSEKYPNVFIGGNGQLKIIEITESLKEAISAK